MDEDGENLRYLNLDGFDYSYFSYCGFNSEFVGKIKMKKDKIEITLMVLVGISFLFAVFLMLWKLFGNSPTSGEITLGLIILCGTWLLSLTYKFGQFQGRSVQFEKNVGNSFERVKDDFKEIKEDLKEIKSKLR
tara:strand:+ start:3067 stop:3468 length:402 start_codon:yes stop_codon:yes gene_type:complete